MLRWGYGAEVSESFFLLFVAHLERIKKMNLTQSEIPDSEASFDESFARLVTEADCQTHIARRFGELQVPNLWNPKKLAITGTH